MTLRKMSNSFKGFEFYSSTFDTDTGVLVRSIEVAEKKRYHWDSPSLVESAARHFGIQVPSSSSSSYSVPGTEFFELELAWARKFGRVRSYTTSDGTKMKRPLISDWRKSHAFSPVPETIDIKITDWCNFGCSYCYMDSTTKGKHAPKTLLTSVFEGLKKAPYQIAFGGGEPTAHPDFPWFLEETKKHGTVPNYTTAGHILRDDVFEATNKYCGGVALTYHAFKGPEYFKKTYDTWRARLDARVQLNVHVIFDKDVADNLLDLQEVGLKNLNVVLLAYYMDIGRATWEGAAPKGVYEVTLPKAMTKVTESGFRIAFSEGLLPYFLSHQLPEVDTRFAVQQEGLFSCYIDDHGRVSYSSFSPPQEDSGEKNSIYQVKLQTLWNRMGDGYARVHDVCQTCKYKSQCHIPESSHYLLCKFAEHNRSPAQHIPERRKRLAVLAD